MVGARGRRSTGSAAARRRDTPRRAARDAGSDAGNLDEEADCDCRRSSARGSRSWQRTAASSATRRRSGPRLDSSGEPRGPAGNRTGARDGPRHRPAVQRDGPLRHALCGRADRPGRTRGAGRGRFDRRSSGCALPLTEVHATAQAHRPQRASRRRVAGLATALLIAWVMSTFLARRVDAIAAVARRYATGDLSRPAGDYGNDEIATVRARS